MIQHPQLIAELRKELRIPDTVADCWIEHYWVPSSAGVFMNLKLHFIDFRKALIKRLHQ